MEILNKNGNEISGKWIKCKKKSYVIEACKISESGKIFNPLERAEISVNKGEILLKGLLGEMWVIGEDSFLAKYTDTDGKGMESLVEKDSFDWTKVATKSNDAIYYALRISKERNCGIYGMKTAKSDDAKYINAKGEMFRTIFEINSKNSISNHGCGDCIMCMCSHNGTPDFSDIWVVDGFVFDKTYSILK